MTTARTFLLTISGTDEDVEHAMDEIDHAVQHLLSDATIDITEPEPPPCGCGGRHWECPGPDAEECAHCGEPLTEGDPDDGKGAGRLDGAGDRLCFGDDEGDQHEPA